MPTALQRLFSVRKGELTVVLLASAYFFCVLTSYYILKPVRDQIGIQFGSDKLSKLWTGTFGAMLFAQPIYAALVARSTRRRLIAVSYQFFALNLLAFFVVAKLTSAWQTFAIGATFYVWVSVFNLFVVSVFWSFMADLFTLDEGKRLFGLVSVGGTLGAICGAWLTSVLVKIVGTTNLFLFSIAFLEIAVVLMYALARNERFAARPNAPAPSPRESVEGREQGGILTGIQLVLQSRYLQGICGFMLGYALVGSFISFELNHVVEAAVKGKEERTALFANIDMAINGISLFVQVFVMSHLVKRIGIGWTILFLPLLSTLALLGLGLSPVLGVAVAAQIGFRGAYFATAKPAREMLFTVVGREAKYKSKNFIDTFVHRGGDVVGGWIFQGLRDLELSLSQLALAGVPMAIAWAAVSRWLGKQEQRFERAAPAPASTSDVGSTAT